MCEVKSMPIDTLPTERAARVVAQAAALATPKVVELRLLAWPDGRIKLNATWNGRFKSGFMPVTRAELESRTLPKALAEGLAYLQSNEPAWEPWPAASSSAPAP